MHFYFLDTSIMLVLGGPQIMSHVPYIAGNFRGRKLSQIGEKYDFYRENFCGLLTCAVPKDATPPNFAEKTFANSHKSFSLKRFRYTVFHWYRV